MKSIERVTEKEEQEPTQTCSNYGLDRLTSFSDSKPKYLEKEANLIEVNNWLKQIKHYIKADYRNNPPARGVYMYLSPLLHKSWSLVLECRDRDEKSLEEPSELVRDEAKLEMLHHQRRMNLIQTKREQDRHSDYLNKLSNLFSVGEYEAMSRGEFQIHLFIESADSQMA